MKKIRLNFIMLIIFITTISTTAFANTNGAECSISKLDSDSQRDIIVCKYLHSRVDYDKEIFVEWINPQGKVDRARKLLIPAGHGSVFDYRYLSGRTKGTWRFIATDREEKFKTKFEVD